MMDDEGQGEWEKQSAVINLFIPIALSFSSICISSSDSSVVSVVTGGPPKLMWLYSSNDALSNS